MGGEWRTIGHNHTEFFFWYSLPFPLSLYIYLNKIILLHILTILTLTDFLIIINVKINSFAFALLLPHISCVPFSSISSFERNRTKQ